MYYEMNQTPVTNLFNKNNNPNFVTGSRDISYKVYIN